MDPIEPRKWLVGNIPKGRRRLLALVVGFMVIAVYAAIPAFAVHDTGLFQLDGNATTVNPPPGDDWDRVCHQVDSTACPTGSNTTGATAVSWVSEPNRASSIFTGGGSKDPQDISNWAWKDAGGLPDKDNLRHSFAARYSVPPSTACPSGGAPTCDVLYFGSDRFDNSGDAQQGFWFFQNKVTLGSTPSGGGFNFNGVHRDGDLLLISDFSNGGTTSTISIYAWNSAVSGNLQLLASSDTANCATVTAHDQFCGLVNANTITMPWTFLDKSNTPNNGALNGEFYEGGVNLSTLGLSGECFSSVASETRSSTSTTATLKDFVLSGFAPCVPGMTTQASTNGSVLPGAAVHDTATITVKGATNPPDATGTVTFFLCGPIASGDCSTGGTNIGTGTLANQSGGTTTDGISVADSPTVNDSSQSGVRGPLAPGRYCFRASWPGDANYVLENPPLTATNDTTECFTVSDTTSATSEQNWLPNDSGTVAATGGTPLNGTLSITLYESADCTGTAVTGQTYSKSLVNATTLADRTLTTTNTTYLVKVDKTISWDVVFTPTAGSNVSGSEHCEKSTVTITN